MIIDNWDTKMVTIDEMRFRILNEVLSYFNLDKDVWLLTKTNHTFKARMVYSTLVYKYLGDGIVRIGKDLKRDHSSISNTLKRMRELRSVNDIVSHDYAYLEKIVLNYLKEVRKYETH